MIRRWGTLPAKKRFAFLILLLTMDPATGEELDETLVAEKAATAQRLAEELQAVKDPAELLERFARLKEEYCEDSGKTVYAEGYTFTPHTMAAEFEAACKALEPYEVSDPVLSKYGYHVILRRPLFASRQAAYMGQGVMLVLLWTGVLGKGLSAVEDFILGGVGAVFAGIFRLAGLM